MITLGGNWPWRFGVPSPPALGALPLIELNRSCPDMAPWPGFSELAEPGCGC
jgi:hypothetical protein